MMIEIQKNRVNYRDRDSRASLVHSNNKKMGKKNAIYAKKHRKNRRVQIKKYITAEREDYKYIDKEEYRKCDTTERQKNKILKCKGPEGPKKEQ